MAAGAAGHRSSGIQGPQYRFVGGKGGVGKTTCAAALALRSAASGFETLVISTDPAPSLGDAFGQRLGPTPRPIRQRPRLYALELDAAQAFAAWIRPRRALLEEIAGRGTWLDRDDVSRLLGLSLPGIDEVAAFLQIAELASSDRYELIVVDTAPTGHLLRLLGTPALLRGFASVFDDMQATHRIMVAALRGRWTPDAADALIGEIREAAERLSALLRDAVRTRLAWVTAPEVMAVEETADGIRWLTDYGIAVDDVIVNRLTRRPPQPCRWCSTRRSAERQALELLRRAIGPAMRVIAVPALEEEPRGSAALDGVGRLIAGAERPALSRGRRQPATATAVLPAVASAPPYRLTTAATRLLMFGGKGGVGKTTCAAAYAVDLAAASRTMRVLLLSTDPAHSLSDALGQRFSDVPRRSRSGPANLWVRELNAARVFGELRVRVAAAIDDLFTARTASGAVEHTLAADDRRAIRDLIELAPPGLDELVAIIEVTETLAARKGRPAYDLIVMDTAPTGHALRLLEMPALVHGWLKMLMALLLKYQPLVGLGDLGAILVRLSRGLRELREMMADPHHTRFVVVTRPASLPRAETLRLLNRLRLAHIHVPVVLVNAVGAGTCSRCQSDARAQTREIAALRRALSSVRPDRPDLLFTPAQLPPPRGPDRLHAWRATWRGQ